LTALRRALLVLLASAGSVQAQTLDSPYRFIDTNQYAGLFGGYVSATTGRLELGPESAPMFGARWAIRVTGPFSFGAEVGYMPTTRTVHDTILATPVTTDSLYRAVGEADMNVLTVLGHVRFNITGGRTWNHLQPFLVFGGGAALDLAGDAAADADLDANERFDFGTSFAGQVGAGIEWYPSARWSARVDAQSMFWKLKVPDAFRLTARGATFPASEWEQNVVLSAGLSIHF
jgi:hypothetical protein